MEKQESMMLKSMLHTGISTFMKTTFIPPRKEELLKAKADIAILGVPFEGCCVGIPGASFGPRVIRQASDDLVSYNLELDVDFATQITLVDCGDTITVTGNAVESHKNIEKTVSEIVSADVLPIVLGGDHSITAASFKGFSKHIKGKIGFIDFDTHFDTADTYAGQKISNCTHVTRVAELENVNPKNIVQIGISNHLNPRILKTRAEEMGITTFYLWDVLERGIKDVTKEAIEIATKDTVALYLTVDIDVLDAAHAPATSVPTPGGLTSRQLIEAVRMVARAGVNAFDLVEVSGPQQDPNLITARAAATVIAEFIGSTVLGKLSS